MTTDTNTGAQLQTQIDALKAELTRVNATPCLNQNGIDFTRLLKLSPIPQALVDNTGRILYLNDRFTTLFGYTLDDIPTQEDWWQLAYPDETYRNNVLATWADAQPSPNENQTDIKPNSYNVGNYSAVVIR